MKLSRLSLVRFSCIPLALALGGCTTTSTALPLGDGGGEDTGTGPGIDASSLDSTVTPTPDAATDATTPSDDATIGTDGAASDAGPDVSPGTDAGTDGPPPQDGALDAASDGGCPLFAGSWTATAVACNGVALTLPTGYSWVATFDGATGATFAETLSGCTLTATGKAQCNANAFSETSSAPNSCTPAACTTWGAQCSAKPAGTQVWGISNQTATSFVATSQNEPDGGPTPVQTCTGAGKSNPVQVTWTKD